jgi:hypothetical protein
VVAITVVMTTREDVRDLHRLPSLCCPRTFVPTTTFGTKKAQVQIETDQNRGRLTDRASGSPAAPPGADFGVGGGSRAVHVGERDRYTGHRLDVVDLRP